MARPSKTDFLKLTGIKFKRFDDSLEKLKASLEREPAKLVSTGIAIGEAQGLFVDLYETIKHYGFLEDGDTRIARIEISLNEIENFLKEEIINIPLIGFNVGTAIISSNVIKEFLGIAEAMKTTKVKG